MSWTFADDTRSWLHRIDIVSLVAVAVVGIQGCAVEKLFAALVAS